MFYHGESVDSLLTQLEAVKNVSINGISREQLQSSAATWRCAQRSRLRALWDLEAKRVGRRAWELAGLQSVSPLLTAYTLSMDAPVAMAAAAAAVRSYSLLKLKLGGEGDFERSAPSRARAGRDA